MYVNITDRELKKASNFQLGKDYYVKNGNGNWYKGQLKNLDVWCINGRERVYGMKIDNGIGIKPEEYIYELDLDNKLELPTFPGFFVFGGKKIKTEDLNEEEIN